MTCGFEGTKLRERVLDFHFEPFQINSVSITPSISDNGLFESARWKPRVNDKKRWYLLISVLLLFTVFGLGVRPIVRCAMVVIGISARQPPWPHRLYERLFAYYPMTEEVQIESEGTPLRMRIVSPQNLNNPPVVVIAHGFVQNGIDDPRVNHWARVLAKGGFRVVLPEVSSERSLLMRASGVDDVAFAVEWAARRYNQRVGLIGVSFSGGLVLTAATRPEIGKDLKLVASISGYNSVLRLSHYYLDDQAVGPDGQPYIGPKPEVGPLFIALQYTDALLPSKDREPVAAALRSYAFIQSNTAAGIQLLKSLTAAQRREYEIFKDSTARQSKAIIQQQVSRDGVRLAAISPTGKLGNVKCPVYLLHGTNDTVIPAGEARWNRQELGQKAEVHYLVSAGLGHVEPDPSSRRRERAKVALFLWRMILALDAKHGTIPLF